MGPFEKRRSSSLKLRIHSAGRPPARYPLRSSARLKERETFPRHQPGSSIPRQGRRFPATSFPPIFSFPISVALANALLPLPDQGSQYISLQNQNLGYAQYLAKVDHVFSEKDHLSGRYFYG